MTRAPYSPSTTISASRSAAVASPFVWSAMGFAQAPARARSSSTTLCGRTSYWTLTTRTASSATRSSTAARATTSSPAQKISVPGPWTTWTALTPGMRSAALVSMLTTLAWA